MIGYAISLSFFEYDLLDQLVRVNDEDQNKTIVYAYDAGGNMTSEKTYLYTESESVTGELVNQRAFVYDTVWTDRLISCDGKALTYADEKYLASYDGMTFAWQRGRQLAQAAKDGMTAAYGYDYTGMRIKKTVNGATTEYAYAGGLLVREKSVANTLLFSYDTAGSPVSVMYNGTEYMYVKNLQSDIIGLIDVNGSLVVEYKYDAWGNILAVTGSMASTLGAVNPLRYRGYYYDAETGFYYVSSRYYSPEIGRFISPDVFISTGTGFVGFNMFAYCNNNPVIMSDTDGKRPVVGTSTNSETTYERKLSFEYMNSGKTNVSSNILEKVCINHSKELKAYSKEHGLIRAALYFVDCVKTGGKWDFKHSWGLDPEQSYKFKGQSLRHDDLGNIHFGYVGSELFSVEILWHGAGVYQAWSDFTGNGEYNLSNIKWHYFYTTFDDPRDQQMVVYGNALWKVDKFF